MSPDYLFISFNEPVHIDDPGYAGDVEESYQLEHPRRKLYRHGGSTRDSEEDYLDSSTDSEVTLSTTSEKAVGRCSSPSRELSCIGCHRAEDRCRCRLKCKGKNAQYIQWKRNLSGSYEVQLNKVDLPEVIAGNYTPAVWHSEMYRRFNRMFSTGSALLGAPIQYRPRYVVPTHVMVPCDVQWPTVHPPIQQVQWIPMLPVQPQHVQQVYPYHPIVYY